MSSSTTVASPHPAAAGSPGEREVLARVLSFVDASGIRRVLADLGTFSLDDAELALMARPGVVGDATRARMVRVLLDLLCECGCLQPLAGGAWTLSVPAAADRALLARGDGMDAGDGEVEFFERCLAHLEPFLGGAPALFDFGAASAASWDRLLASDAVASARSVLARLVLPRDARPVDGLVLCYGPGFDLVEIENRCPAARVTALDFTNAFEGLARRRLRRPERVRWMDRREWRGFGATLPFPDASFDLVIFTCAEPYIPADLRSFTLRDVRRVVRPGGRAGVLTHSYPDAARVAVPDPWVRRATLCHDFLESVCEGWCGFSDAASLRAQFEGAGFVIDLVTHNSSIWRLAAAPGFSIVERRR